MAEQIKNIEEGTIVTDDFITFSIVKKCVHNNKYYALAGGSKDLLRDGYTKEDIKAATDVNDMDENHVLCCG